MPEKTLEDLIILVDYITPVNEGFAAEVHSMVLQQYLYADSESEVQFIPPRHNLKIFSLQNCKIANISKNFPRI